MGREIAFSITGLKLWRKNMDWLEVYVKTSPEGIEIVCGLLYQCGLTGLMIDDERDFEDFMKNPNRVWDYIDDGLISQKSKCGAAVTFFVSDNLSGRETFKTVQNGLEKLKKEEKEFDLGTLEIKVKNIKEEDWENNWKKYFKPISIGEKIIIKPSWENLKEPTDRKILEINPGNIFGTGSHETTQLCIEYIEDVIKENDIVLDIGCGSGILSIASLLLGAKYADAVDIDTNAIKIAYENLQMNNISCDRYNVVSGDILNDEILQECYTGRNYDIVVANIVADIIISLSKQVPLYIKKSGLFICSGIITDRLEEVYRALKYNDFKVEDTKIKGDWAAILSVYIGKSED